MRWKVRSAPGRPLRFPKLWQRLTRVLRTLKEICPPLNSIARSRNEFEPIDVALLGGHFSLWSLICWAEDSATAEVTNLSKNCSYKPIIITARFGIEVSKAPLFKEQYGSASLEIIRERCCTVPCLAYPFVNTRYEVEIAVSVVSVIRESEFFNLGPPVGVGTRDLDKGFIHCRNLTDKIKVSGIPGPIQCRS